MNNSKPHFLSVFIIVGSHYDVDGVMKRLYLVEYQHKRLKCRRISSTNVAMSRLALSHLIIIIVCYHTRYHRDAKNRTHGQYCTFITCNLQQVLVCYLV